MKPNDVPETLQAKVRAVLSGPADVEIYADLRTTAKNVQHALGLNGDRPVTWDFIGRLAFYRPDLWAQIAPHIPGGHGSLKMRELVEQTDGDGMVTP